MASLFQNVLHPKTKLFYYLFLLLGLKFPIFYSSCNDVKVQSQPRIISVGYFFRSHLLPQMLSGAQRFSI